MFPGLIGLFWVAVGIGAAVLGVRLLARAASMRSWGHAVGGVALLGVLALYGVWWNATGVDEWNTPAPREALIGTWMAGESRLELFPDGTFRIDARDGAAKRVHLTRASGEWTIDDWNLTLHLRNGQSQRLRTVVANGAYRIIESPGDLDGWVAWRGFNRTPSSRVRP